MVPSAVQDLRWRRPVQDRMGPDVLQILPGEGLAEVRRDAPLPGQLLLADAGPAHHLLDQPLHVHHRGEQQRPRQRCVLICQQSEPGPQAGAEQPHLLPAARKLRQQRPQLRHDAPGDQIRRLGGPRSVAGQIHAHGLPSGVRRGGGKGCGFLLAPALPMEIEKAPPAGLPPADRRSRSDHKRPPCQRHLRIRTGRRSRPPPGPRPPPGIRCPAGSPPAAAPGPGWPPCCS